MLSFKIIGFLVMEKKLRFTIYGHGGNIVNVTRLFLIKLCSLSPTTLHMKFDFYWPGRFRGEKMFQNKGHMLYI